MRRAFAGCLLVIPAGMACSRPNPGFEYEAPVPVTTDGGEVTTAPTSGEPPLNTTTTSGGETTHTALTTEMSTTTTSGDPASSSEGGESSSTGSVMVEWPTDCKEADRVVSGRVAAAADTFLLHEIYFNMNQMCAFGGPLHCENIDLGATDFFEVAFENSANMNPADDLASVYAARFPKPEPEYMGYAVEPEGWLKVRVVFHVVHQFDDPNEWSAVAFDIYRFAAGDVWQEGAGFGPTPCLKPGASFRCRTCPAEEADGECVEAWSGGAPFVEGVNVMAAGVKLFADPGEGEDVTLEFPGDQWGWLAEEGMLVVPQSPVPQNVLEIKAKDYDDGALGPFIEVVHCPPVISSP